LESVFILEPPIKLPARRAAAAFAFLFILCKTQQNFRKPSHLLEGFLCTL
jgi:hypothetical protein